jgi:hypothetical protein
VAAAIAELVVLVSDPERHDKLYSLVYILRS